MNDQGKNRYDPDLEELLEQVDALFPELREEAPPKPDFDPDDYTPAELRTEDPLVYRNFYNQYGAGVRNYANGYGAGQEEALPVSNGDFRRGDVFLPGEEEEPEQVPEPVRERPRKKRPKKKRRGCAIGCLGMLLIPVALVLAVILLIGRIPAPNSGVAAELRKPDTATILLCGTDLDGTRTDTMMLLYLSGSEKRVGLLSLPRDTYTITSRGDGAKLNSAYGRNGKGHEGMEGLLDYVQDILGYRPDGYLLVNMEAVPTIVDAMGGLKVEVPMSFELEGVYLEEGLQQLDGVQVLQLLRYRSGYAMQDLGRIEVQRRVIAAAMDQWITPEKLSNAMDALALVQENSITSLSTPHYFWVAKTILASGGQITNHTLPGWADYIGNASYYILDRAEVARLINESYNPTTKEIRTEDLNIAG